MQSSIYAKNENNRKLGLEVTVQGRGWTKFEKKDGEGKIGDLHK